eukprot:scaffold22753_cov108-Isochrysis_galbana.AAC.4
MARAYTASEPGSTRSAAAQSGSCGVGGAGLHEAPADDKDISTHPVPSAPPAAAAPAASAPVLSIWTHTRGKGGRGGGNRVVEPLAQASGRALRADPLAHRQPSPEAGRAGLPHLVGTKRGRDAPPLGRARHTLPLGRAPPRPPRPSLPLRAGLRPWVNAAPTAAQRCACRRHARRQQGDQRARQWQEVDGFGCGEKVAAVSRGDGEVGVDQLEHEQRQQPAALDDRPGAEGRRPANLSPRSQAQGVCVGQHGRADQHAEADARGHGGACVEECAVGEGVHDVPQRPGHREENSRHK